MKWFWRTYFLHFDSVHGVLLWIGRRLLAFPLYAVSPFLIVLLPLVFLGARAAARDATLRPLVWAWLGLIVGLTLAAALDIYPMGAERTALFADPLFWLFAVIGCDQVRKAPAPSTKRRRFQAVCALYVLGVCLLRPPVVYSAERDSLAVAETLRRRHDGDGLLMQHTGLLALAYYGGHPLRFTRYEDVCHRFAAWPDWPDMVVLPIKVDGQMVRDQPSLADPILDTFYAHPYPRIFYLSTHADDRIDARVLERAARAGYRMQRIDESPHAHVFILQRTTGSQPHLKT